MPVPDGFSFFDAGGNEYNTVKYEKEFDDFEEVLFHEVITFL